MADNINHPAHYTGRGIGYECIDITQYQTFLVGNVIKYLWRYPLKDNPLEDLRKARWYALRAAMRQETVDLHSGHCKEILCRLVSSTYGYETAAWNGFLQQEWHYVLSTLDAMTERIENNAQAH